MLSSSLVHQMNYVIFRRNCWYVMLITSFSGLESHQLLWRENGIFNKSFRFISQSTGITRRFPNIWWVDKGTLYLNIQKQRIKMGRRTCLTTFEEDIHHSRWLGVPTLSRHRAVPKETWISDEFAKSINAMKYSRLFHYREHNLFSYNLRAPKDATGFEENIKIHLKPS